MKISLIITTFNWPEALMLVLESIAHQSLMPNEIVIADDGARVLALLQGFRNQLSITFP